MIASDPPRKVPMQLELRLDEIVAALVGQVLNRETPTATPFLGLHFDQLPARAEPAPGGAVYADPAGRDYIIIEDDGDLIADRRIIVHKENAAELIAGHRDDRQRRRGRLGGRTSRRRGSCRSRLEERGTA